MTTPTRAFISCTHREDGRDQHEQPDHAVAVAGADHRPGGDAAGVVAGVGGDEARPHHREDDEEPGAADAPASRRPPTLREVRAIEASSMEDPR